MFPWPDAWTYMVLHLFTLSVPLALSFDAKVHFWRRWRYLFPAIGVAAAIFLVWDVLFTQWGVWAFNHQYVLGYYFLGLPLEEWLFFVTVPYACIFLADVFEAWFPLREGLLAARGAFLAFGLLVAVVFLLGLPRLYTSWTMGGLLLWLPLHRRLHGFHGWLHILRTWAICLIPFFIVNGVLTALPVVTYNDAENLGIRLYTIPAEDSLYGFLLFLMAYTMYKHWQKRVG
jgi:lycopene cyclase domain-containing protein